MKLINTHGLAFVGPGSEWFWTAVSGLVLFVTFLAIYRQLRLQAGALIRDELNRVAEEWFGERLSRERLAVFRQLRSGDPIDPDTPLVWGPCNFWENLGALGHSGQMDVQLIRIAIGNYIVFWWDLMAPHIESMRRRQSRSEKNAFFKDFQWLAQEMERGSHSEPTAHRQAAALMSSSAVMDAQIRKLEEEIRLHELLRSPRTV